jgi:nudix-type nucleoside diphosphatase (YffH/AdpP family)
MPGRVSGRVSGRSPVSGAVLRLRAVYEGWARMLVATVRLPDGSEATREIEDHGEAVAVLPYDPARRVALLVRQFRAPVRHVGEVGDLLEAPAGLRDEPDAEVAARREALEEVGLRLGPLESVCTAWTMPGISTERMALYLAPYAAADRVAAGGGLAEESESVTVVELPLAELARLADAGALADLKTLALVQTLRLRRPDLFG